ncbi:MULTISPECIES: helix-turn-helix transcriptional regulator [unclassified Oceanispirochaeta]|uniref:helix-turn-helix transcriptional regulator n=1 Tax=unclassified Oceanispirochaeta TaxID=2635722 RepID=UPI000E09ADB4|nr:MULTISPECIES: helix-turn-helix transcriptional regulator [unclassified Oceanispirochaeta]MBF9017195.1 LuxR family transcriptional regulator [Oceanispirochaeta sp. M2]NPD73644.1 LuxR family transcriptional regulator [Oceanispirochaeta sp. M1]RDG30574.1 LuxR family transcriptional regulator [Oceanispirochaeta sp. M1]
MRSLNDYLHQTESRRGEEEAGKLRTLFLLFLFLWSVLQHSNTITILIPLFLGLINYLTLTFLKKNKRFLNPYFIISLEIILASSWSFFHSKGYSFPLLPVLLFIIYCASLRLKINLIVMAGVESIVLMNLLYLYSLIPVSDSLDVNIFNWPEFNNQIMFTLLLITFSIAVLSRPRIISRLVNQQQVYFDTIRNENTALKDSLEEIAGIFKLSSREKDVLGILIQGKTYRMIAGELYISLDTVKSHVKSIYRKCNVGSKGELLIVLQDILQEAALVREKESE